MPFNIFLFIYSLSGLNLIKTYSSLELYGVTNEELRIFSEIRGNLLATERDADEGQKGTASDKLQSKYVAQLVSYDDKWKRKSFYAAQIPRMAIEVGSGRPGTERIRNAMQGASLFIIREKDVGKDGYTVSYYAFEKNIPVLFLCDSLDKSKAPAWFLAKIRSCPDNLFEEKQNGEEKMFARCKTLIGEPSPKQIGAFLFNCASSCMQIHVEDAFFV